MTHSIKLIVVAASLFTGLAGCVASSGSSSAVATTAPAVDPSTQPSNVFVTGRDFDQLWDAADAATRELLFKPDRQDRRTGTLQTEPMTSAQWFEPWRQELKTPEAVVQSSLATIRRTVTVQIVRDEATDTFRALPSVLIERFARAESRITSSARYRQVYEPNRSTGSAERDQGIILPNAYWYPIGNDPELERTIAAKIEHHLNG